MTTFRVHYEYSGRNSFDITAETEDQARRFFQETLGARLFREHSTVWIAGIEERP